MLSLPFFAYLLLLSAHVSTHPAHPHAPPGLDSIASQTLQPQISESITAVNKTFEPIRCYRTGTDPRPIDVPICTPWLNQIQQIHLANINRVYPSTSQASQAAMVVSNYGPCGISLERTQGATPLNINIVRLVERVVDILNKCDEFRRGGRMPLAENEAWSVMVYRNPGQYPSTPAAPIPPSATIPISPFARSRLDAPARNPSTPTKTSTISSSTSGLGNLLLPPLNISRPFNPVQCRTSTPDPRPVDLALCTSWFNHARNQPENSISISWPVDTPSPIPVWRQGPCAILLLHKPTIPSSTTTTTTTITRLDASLSDFVDRAMTVLRSCEGLRLGGMIPVDEEHPRSYVVVYRNLGSWPVGPPESS